MRVQFLSHSFDLELVLQKAYVIQVDTREQKPLVFPATIQVAREWWPGQAPKLERVRLEVVKTKLETGDYRLLGFERATLIERKGSLSELSKNLFSNDRDRMWRALSRLKEECWDPIMVLDGGMERYTQKDPYTEWPPEAIVDETQRICLKLGIRLQVLPGSTARQRRIAAEWVARTLINGALAFESSPVSHDTPKIQPGVEVGVPEPGRPRIQ